MTYKLEVRFGARTDGKKRAALSSSPKCLICVSYYAEACTIICISWLHVYSEFNFALIT